ncbi:MAG: class I adenylate-forming enzyme family protein [Myxococcota bacterium]
METNDPALTLGRFLQGAAGRHGDRCAIRFADRSIRFRELADEARALARALIGAGVGKGTRVAVLMANRPEWIVSAFAVGMAGGVLVPVNTFASEREFAFILRHSDAALLLMQPSLLKHEFLEDLLAVHPEVASGAPGRLRCAGMPQLRRVVCLGIDAPRGGVETWSQLLAQASDVPETLLDAIIAEVEPSDDAMIIYTSGTTADPKGVLHGHRAAVLQGHRFADLMGLERDDRLFTTYPFFWTAGIAMSLNPALASGACLLLQEAFEPCAALDIIERERATAIHAWPHQQKALAEHPSASSRDLRSLRKIDSASPIASLAGTENDEYSMAASYGMSETFTIASAIAADAPRALRQSTSGRPLLGMQLCIVDPATGEAVGVGVDGEIAVKGVTFMRGYYKVLPENYLDADGFFRTQDGGSLDSDGFLHWTGRLDNLIKTGGANVSPVEIEEVLEAHAGVKVGIPVGIAHPTLGEVVVLCVVPTADCEPDAEEIRGFLRERLAAYKLPKRVLFFRADELSYTGNQKIQVGPLKQAARRRLEEEGAVIEGYRFAAD